MHLRRSTVVDNLPSLLTIPHIDPISKLDITNPKLDFNSYGGILTRPNKVSHRRSTSEITKSLHRTDYQTISPSRKGDDLLAKMGNKTRTKLFGTMSVSDMANSNNLDKNGIEGYRIDPKLRFNFHNKDFKIS